MKFRPDDVFLLDIGDTFAKFPEADKNKEFVKSLDWNRLLTCMPDGIDMETEELCQKTGTTDAQQIELLDKICTNIDLINMKFFETVIKNYNYVFVTDTLSKTYQVFIEEAEKRLERTIFDFWSFRSCDYARRKPELFVDVFLDFTDRLSVIKPEQCIMVGDNYERDIKPMLDRGFRAIHVIPENSKSLEPIEMENLIVTSNLDSLSDRIIF